MKPGYVEFEFDLPEALLARLIQVLDGMGSAVLDSGNVSDIPDAQGVYQLFLDEELVYIGKTDAEAGLRKRLDRHRSKIQHRDGLAPNRVTFKAVRIYVFTAMDLETQLIHHYGGQSNVHWNGSGFGSNDPGRERDTTKYKDDHFDAMYPIDIDRPLDMELPNAESAAVIFSTLKSTLPYTFRYQGASARSRTPHPDLEAAEIDLTGIEGEPTARNVITEVVQQLPEGWQATQLPSHIILYKNDTRKFPQGTVIARSPA